MSDKSKKNTTIGMPLVLPSASIPPRPALLKSAYDYVNDDVLVTRLEQLRGHHNLKGGARAVANLDKAICVLILKFGFDGEMIIEVLSDAANSLAEEMSVLEGLKK